MNITGAIFDMDGTLVDSLMLWDMLWAAVSTRYLSGKPFRPDPELDRDIRTVPLLEAMGFVHARTGIGESGRALCDLANEVFADFYRHAVQPKPGAPELLAYLQAQGVKMCLATASDPMLVDLALNHCGMAHYFIRRFSCSELGRGKEFPDVFLHALDALGTPQAETWVFEDSYVALSTAADAGFPTVGIYDCHSPGQDILRARATIYIAPDESMDRLIPR